MNAMGVCVHMCAQKNTHLVSCLITYIYTHVYHTMSRVYGIFGIQVQVAVDQLA